MSSKGSKKTRVSEGSSSQAKPPTPTRKSLRASPRRKQIENDWNEIMGAQANTQEPKPAPKEPPAVGVSLLEAAANFEESRSAGEKKRGFSAAFQDTKKYTGGSKSTHLSENTAQHQQKQQNEPGNTSVAPAFRPHASYQGHRSPAVSPKKRPYRRTKRPAGYNDKSTITVSTKTASTPVNVYDAVLNEADDLLRAASEQQALGRLKMSSNYLLLLHARLVGLGKKFDWAKRTQGFDDAIMATPHGAPAAAAAQHHGLKPTKLDMATIPEGGELVVLGAAHHDPNDRNAVLQSTPRKATPQKNRGEEEKKSEEEKKLAARPAVPPSNRISEAALNQLTNYLPSDIEFDSVMIEHLARAAVELQSKRTGRQAAHDGLLNSQTLCNTEQLLHYNKTPITPSKAPVAWTEAEHVKFQQAAHKFGTSDPAKIAKFMGSRNEAQVRAYMRNASEIEKGAAAIEQEMMADTPRKHKGRGRKPPTTAINTVPNANLDAKSMLQNLNNVL